MTIPPFQIVKTQVQAKPRQLSARWTIEEPQLIQVTTQRESLKILLKKWYITNYGYRVPFYGTDTQCDEAVDWCDEHFGNGWIYRPTARNIPTSEFVRNVIERFKANDLDSGPPASYEPDLGNVEDLIFQSLAEEIAHEIDNEILMSLGVPRKREKPTSNHFWFVNHDDFLLFKLTWGGE